MQSIFSLSSRSEEDDESEDDRVDDESRIARSRLPDEDLEDELEIECLLAGRCSKTPSPKS